ncbi:YwdI family protein [Salisediminibacterium selenitireducens]|uniref:Uncharacterized protein n=1 Tax=Bacillus selenitireducens (strain ATCC 700615 / DSM 15326 / MLS10) TaxID=439292 RepID=D6Y1C7_BACIE|nr:YwdI family protein [Salisediminibacterium selenitireducens]ADI00714.1 hypothetical protein Bsel_3232 [[Bacillus] selenitireducens MLS10]
MDIPVSTVIEKMEQALGRMKDVQDQPAAVAEQARLIQAYSELLAESSAPKSGYVPPVHHASLEDLEKTRVEGPAAVPGKPLDEPEPKQDQVRAYEKGQRVGDMAAKQKKQTEERKRETIYDEDEKPQSDSLLDF